MLGKDGLFAVQDENAFRTARDGRRRSGASRFPEAFVSEKRRQPQRLLFLVRKGTGPGLLFMSPVPARSGLRSIPNIRKDHERRTRFVLLSPGRES